MTYLEFWTMSLLLSYVVASAFSLKFVSHHVETDAQEYDWKACDTVYVNLLCCTE